MSDVYAARRFQDAVRTLQALEGKLRAPGRTVDPKEIDAVLIDLAAAIPGLTDEDLGRALVLKAYAYHWRFTIELEEKSVFDVIGAPVDPGITRALEDARKGRKLLRTPEDVEWANATVTQLEEYQR